MVSRCGHVSNSLCGHAQVQVVRSQISRRTQLPPIALCHNVGRVVVDFLCQHGYRIVTCRGAGLIVVVDNDAGKGRHAQSGLNVQITLA